MSYSGGTCVSTPWPSFSVSSRKPGVNRRMLVRLSGLPSASCTSSCCLTQIEKETLPEIVVANMLISVSSVDNTHPATWQWVTIGSKVLASPLTESCVFSACDAHVFVFFPSALSACGCLLACSVCGSVSTVSGWAGWNYCSGLSHPHLSCMCCCVRLSHQYVEKCGSWRDFCLTAGFNSMAVSTLYQVRCVDNTLSGHVLCWHVSHLWLGCILGVCICNMQWTSRWTHEVWRWHMFVSHRKNPNIFRKVMLSCRDLTRRLDKPVTFAHWPQSWNLQPKLKVEPGRCKCYTHAILINIPKTLQKDQVHLVQKNWDWPKGDKWLLGVYLMFTLYCKDNNSMNFFFQMQLFLHNCLFSICMWISCSFRRPCFTCWYVPAAWEDRQKRKLTGNLKFPTTLFLIQLL